jgi:hypothetical protein
MAQKDLHNNIKVQQDLDPVTLTASVNTTGLDNRGFGSVEHIVNVGESGDTLSGTVYWTFTLEDSADNSTFATAADADILGTSSTGVIGTIDAAAEDDTHIRVGYIGDKRYTRVAIAATGTHTNGTPMAASGVLGNPTQAKTSD